MPHFTAHVLKRVAEAADGLRGYGHHYVRVHNEELRDVEVSKSELRAGKDQTVMEVDTPQHRGLAQMGTKIDKIVIHYTDGRAPTEHFPTPPNENTSDPRWVDAMFFTPSAVDKFVVPYLASVYDDNYSRQVHDEFVDDWNAGEAMGLCHAPPTVFFKC